ncbi:hypothetical protein RIF29_21429 [Crotalaria pallida]|uniref:Uncharacterized protein n=1 Tax=Crotalaria pallida TaxID=3830 RepID=A0AAN9IDE0_CROPI
MGCFLACFGLSNKRKRRKTLYNVLGGHQKYGNYQVLAITEKSIIPYSDIRDKDGCKEKNSVKRKKKKVTFNLNVQIFEPNPTAYQALDNEEEENENKTAEPEGRSSSFSTLGEGSAGLTMTYPSNYRYYNCCYDEEDEIGGEESDIEDYDDDEDDEFDDDEYCWDDGCSDESLGNEEAEVNDQGNIRQKELSESCYSSVAEERIKNQMLLASDDTELKSNLSGRDRSMNMHSVLVPVENLTQWKAIKAKVASSKHRRKENVPSEPNTSMPFKLSPCSLESNILQSKPLLQEIAVDASLSNWLVSPSYDVSKATIHCQ